MEKRLRSDWVLQFKVNHFLPLLKAPVLKIAIDGYYKTIVMIDWDLAFEMFSVKYLSCSCVCLRGERDKSN